MISASLSNLVRALIDNRLEFERADCVLCGAGADGGLLCAPCHYELPRHATPACPVCAGPSDGHVCGNCLKQPPAYERCLAALRYAFPADRLVQALKYGQRLALAPLLADVLRETVHTAPRPDVLLPLPLHPDRARERGFNQTTELAKPLARALRLPLDTTSLARTRNTAPQASLPLDDRQRNVKGAFTCAGSFAGKHVALLDDVMTSGATLNEAAKTLKRAGAAEVSLWIVARALPHQ